MGRGLQMGSSLVFSELIGLVLLQEDITSPSDTISDRIILWSRINMTIVPLLLPILFA